MARFWLCVYNAWIGLNYSANTSGMYDFCGDMAPTDWLLSQCQGHLLEEVEPVQSFLIDRTTVFTVSLDKQGKTCVGECAFSFPGRIISHLHCV